jgi:hypothetical protein
VLGHPVGGSLAQTLGILVDAGPLVVVGLCIVDQALAVAFYLCEVGVFSPVEFVLVCYVSNGRVAVATHGNCVAV